MLPSRKQIGASHLTEVSLSLAEAEKFQAEAYNQKQRFHKKNNCA